MIQTTVLEGKVLGVTFKDPFWIVLELGDKSHSGIKFKIKFTDKDAAYIREHLTREKTQVRQHERATLRLTLDMILKEIGVPDGMYPQPIHNVYKLIKRVQRGEDPLKVMEEISTESIPLHPIKDEDAITD